jgi:glutaredoxin
MANNLLVLTKTDCYFCQKLKEFMEKNDIQYDEISANGDIGAWKSFFQFMGMEKVTLPQVMISNTQNPNELIRIGGYDEFTNWYTGMHGS